MPLLPETLLCLLWGVFSRAFFFFCSFSFFFLSRVRSFPSRCRFGVVSWLLFLAAAFFVPFFFWVCCLVRFCFSFSREVLLPSLSLVWSVVWCGFVLAGVLSLASSGSSPCLSCASCLRWGFVPLSWSALHAAKAFVCVLRRYPHSRTSAERYP